LTAGTTKTESVVQQVPAEVAKKKSWGYGKKAA
jgi:hypothetical protein